MKNILGLDLGTNSIGWALIDNESHRIIKSGSRIIPMDAATMGDYEKGNLKSADWKRTSFRGMRRLYERAKLRRERLLRVLNILGFLPEEFRRQIDFEHHPGQFIDGKEPLIAYHHDENGQRVFSYMSAFEEMLTDFRATQPELVRDGRRVPYDWTIYYLRHKALTQPVTKEELAWIILNFNTKRGYYQLRSESEKVTTNKNEEYAELEVVSVEKTGEDKKRAGYYWYTITYDNEAEQKITSTIPPRQIGDKVELIVTTARDKAGEIKKSVRSPKEDDWTLMKKRTEHNIEEEECTVGSYIYQHILADPTVKVRGKLVHTIERKFYKKELKQILNKQKEFIPELQDASLYEACIKELYRNNEAHIQSIANKDFTDLFVNDIIFYQRPLKSKKSTISNCPYESYYYKNKETGELIRKPIKCIAKSNPLYQEFRLWQFIHNLRIYKKSEEVSGRLQADVDVTDRFLTTPDDYAKLFSWLNDRKEIKQKELLKYEAFGLSKSYGDYRWNFVEDKQYPCNETLHEINRRMKSILSDKKLSSEAYQQLWHILYSIDDPIEIRKALTSFAQNQKINSDDFVNAFYQYVPEKTKSYGAYSEKAIKKLLPLMRRGSYWAIGNIDEKTRRRLDNIINGVADDSISTCTREKLNNLTDITMCQGMPLWQACYAVYDRHSEAADTTKWEQPDDIDTYLSTELKQHSLRNPIVETVISETLRVVRDIWKTYGRPEEIHVELGRNLKQDAKSRKQDAIRMAENEQTNLRIRALLQELSNPECGVENVRPHSPSQMELLKIYENEVLQSTDDIPEEISNIIKDLGKTDPKKRPSLSDITKYRLWLEQKYQSPYTGHIIPLSKLFTPAYQIEHVIPQSRYFDDSISNKVICEAEVNKEKDRMLGYEFIINKGGSIVKGSFGQEFKIFDKVQYEDFVKQRYAHNKTKMKKLLMDDIPDGFIQRQLNDSRYMSKKIISILSNIVREDGEKEATSKHIIVTSGAVTDRLKKEWGIKDVWNDIIAPRFKRLNKLTDSNNYGMETEKEGRQYFQINVPIELSAGFSKKRIDHRHHAMDAIIIACTTRNHVNFLNNSTAASDRKDIRRDLQHTLCTKTKTDSNGNYVWRFNKPWDTFTQDTRQELEGIIVSFKQNLRIINKMSNYYQHYVDGRKTIGRQNKDDGWAIRKSLHKATVSGKVNLKRSKTVGFKEALNDWSAIKDKTSKAILQKIIAQYKNYDPKTIFKYFKDRNFKVEGKDFSKLEVYYNTSDKEPMSAHRVNIDTTFDEKEIRSITDTGIQKIMLKHLHTYDDAQGKTHPEAAFSPEGIEKMNQNIRMLNDGKDHKPIFKVRKAEILGMKFAVGERGHKDKKWVEADKGTNLFFAIYESEENKRSYSSIPLNEAIDRLKRGENIADERDQNGNKLLFVLSPMDLVYVPDPDDAHIDEVKGNNNIFKMVSCTGKQCFFVPETYANVICKGKELESKNKVESYDGINIKKSCYKITVDRLGKVRKIFKG